MTEEEATNVVLAIAQPLAWQRVGSYFVAFCRDSKHGVGNYKVSSCPNEPEHKRLLARAQLAGRTLTGPAFRTEAEAKAACERHHLTGRWE